MSKNFSSETVSAKIGEDYKEWSNGDCIFIDAPTGSGKTTFILETLLPYLSGEGKRILYLVNRRILKEQLENMISDLFHEQYTIIEIALYQQIEEGICNIQNGKKDKEDQKDQDYSSNWLEELSKYDCVVCDEAHYFLADANYNTNTSMSFQWIQAKFQNKLSIFMSATCCEIQSYIEKNNLYKPGTGYTLCYGLSKYEKPLLTELDAIISSLNGEEPIDDLTKQKMITYKITRNYDYIGADNIFFVKNREDIVDLVVEGSGKWLIFVDNIKFGKELEKAIKRKKRALGKGISSESVDKEAYMLSSGYKRDPEGNKQVDHIVRKKIPLTKAFITTSVLDNGINIQDIELRNVLLFADTEAEFIQMLGRKRRDALPFNLYIFKYDKNHFCKRKKQLVRRKKMADGYLKYIEDKIAALCKKHKGVDWCHEENLGILNECEKRCVERQHIKLMQDLSNHYVKYNDVSSVFTVYGGKWYLNRLAAQNIENLNMYYKRIIEKFEAEGEDAFAREQLHWLGKDNVAEDIIKRSRDSKAQKALEHITARIQEAGMEWMDREEWKSFKNEMKWDLQCVFETLDKEALLEEDKKLESTVDNAIYQTTTHLSPKHVRFLNKYCGFPFELEESKKEESGKKVPIFKFAYLEEIVDEKK